MDTYSGIFDHLVIISRVVICMAFTFYARTCCLLPKDFATTTTIQSPDRALQRFGAPSTRSYFSRRNDDPVDDYPAYL